MTTALILAIIAVSTTTAAALSCSDGDICVNQSGWWRDGGAFSASTTPIQAAVNNANAGEMICVAAGSYTENVDIATPHLTLAGEGAGVVTVTAANAGDHVFEVTADYVNISGFTATGATADYWPDAGFYLYGADHCNISENDCSYNSYGIYLNSSSNNTLTSNNADSNDIGICLWSSSNNTLVSNTANSNDIGILLWSSSNNTLLNNDNLIYNNYYGIGLLDSSNNVLTSNTASNDYGGIWLVESSNNTLTSNTANSNGIGIFLDSSSNNTLTSNTANSNGIGIGLYDSNNDNLIYNNYFNNTVNACDDGSNQWNTTKTAGTNIIGGPFLGGNYWSDYAGVDNDGDGLGDTLLPYNSAGKIHNGGDYHPLVSAAEPPLDEPPVFTTADALIALRIAVGSYPLDLYWDVSGDGQVTSLDALMITMDLITGS